MGSIHVRVEATSTKKKGDLMAKAAAGSRGANSSVADELRGLGMKGVLVQMAERGQLLAVEVRDAAVLPPQGARRVRSDRDEAHYVGAIARPLSDPQVSRREATSRERSAVPHLSAISGTTSGGGKSERCSRTTNPSPRLPRP